jgi:hypothetical protein
MHCPVLLTFNRDCAHNGQKAKEHVISFLDKTWRPVHLESGDEYGKYYCFRGIPSLTDSYRIGGRWSGLFIDQNEIFWDELEEKKLVTWDKGGLTTKQLEKLGYDARGICKLNVSNKDKRVQDIYFRVGGIGRHTLSDHPLLEWKPYDTALLTSDLYARFLKCFEGKSEQEYQWVPRVERYGYADLESEKVSTDFIDRKWIVILDTHNQRST